MGRVWRGEGGGLRGLGREGMDGLWDGEMGDRRDRGIFFCLREKRAERLSWKHWTSILDQAWLERE